jgi:hypothetical protein
MPVRTDRPRRAPCSVLLRWSIRLALTTAVLAFVLLANPPVVWAVDDIPTVINNLRNWIVGILAGLATLFSPSAGCAT